MIALSGADFSANINGIPIPLNQAVIINKKHNSSISYDKK
jgi:allophanate hydrolase subunit 2